MSQYTGAFNPLLAMNQIVGAPTVFNSSRGRDLNIGF
jgi:hypothetical protein